MKQDWITLMQMRSRIPIAISFCFILGVLAPASGQEMLWRPLFEEGTAAMQKGELSLAERQLNAALANAEQTGKSELRLEKTLRMLSRLYVLQGKLDEAEKCSRRALDLLASDDDWQGQASNLESLGQILARQTKFKEAEEVNERAIALLRKHPEGADLLSSILLNQAVLLKEAGAVRKVEPLLLESLKIREQASKQQTDAGTLQVFEKLADFYLSQSRLAEAQPLYKKAITLRQRMGDGQDPAIIKDLEHLGLVYQKQGKSADAEALLKEALVMSEKTFTAENLQVADELMALGSFYTDEDRAKEAIPLLKRAWSLRMKLLKPNDPKIADALIALGNAYGDIDDYPEAEKALTQALAIDEEGKGQQELRAARDLAQIGKLYLSQGKYDLAEKAYQGALDRTKKLRGAEHPDSATCMNNLAFLYRNQGKYEQSEQVLKEALAVRQKVFGEAHPVVAQNLINLADVLSVVDKYPEAETALLKALEIDEKALDADHEYVALILRDLIDVLKSQNKNVDAEKYARKLLARDERALPDGGMLIATDLNLLAKILIAQNKTDEAKIHKKRANDIQNAIMASASSQPDLDDKLANPGGQLRAVKDKWALVIGISSFQDNTLNLKYAAKDATDFRNFLINQEHFNPDHVKLLTDKEATRANIVNLLGQGWLGRAVNADDLAVIYISSHGSQARQEIGGANFIVPYEGNLSNIVFSGIPMQWLTVGLKDQVRCERLCVILDVCHGGAAAPDKKAAAIVEMRASLGGDTASDGKLLTSAPSSLGTNLIASGDSIGQKGMERTTGNSPTQGKGIERTNRGYPMTEPAPSAAPADPSLVKLGSGEIVVAASQADQVSWESKRYANGVFTRRLMEGLRTRGESTTILQAFDYLKDMVEEEVLRDRGELQTPVIVPRHPKNFEPQFACKTSNARSGVEPSAVSPSSPQASSPSGAKQPSAQKQPVSIKDNKVKSR